jgi:hypothetical protein
VIELTLEDGDAQVAAWWDGLPGLDWASPEQPGMRPVCDQMLAVTAIMTFWRPDISQATQYGGFGKPGNDAFRELLGFLTPLPGEPSDPTDGFFRRRALILALDRNASRPVARTVVEQAVFLYETFRNPYWEPDPNRRPRRRRLKEPATLS